MIQLMRSICQLWLCFVSVMCCVHAGNTTTGISSNTIAHNSAFKALMTKEALNTKKEFVAFPDIQKILKNGVLTVALLQDDIFPFFFYDKEAGFLGIDRELINAIARALGPNIKLKIIRTAKTYDDIIKQVSSGKAHLGVSKINYTPARSLKVIYGDESYITLHPALLVNKKAIPQQTDKFNAGKFFSARNKHKICTIFESSNAYIVSKFFPGAVVVASENEKARDKKFAEGKCDALLLDDYDVKKKLEEDSFLKKFYKVAILEHGKTSAYIVTNPQYPNLSDFIDDLVRNSTSLQFELHSSFDQYKKYIKPLRDRKEALELKAQKEKQEVSVSKLEGVADKPEDTIMETKEEGAA